MARTKQSPPPTPPSASAGRLAVTKNWNAPAAVIFPEVPPSKPVVIHLAESSGNVLVDDGSGVRYLCGTAKHSGAVEVAAPLDHPACGGRCVDRRAEEKAERPRAMFAPMMEVS